MKLENLDFCQLLPTFMRPDSVNQALALVLIKSFLK